MTQQDGRNLFDSMHTDFFKREDICRIPEGEVYEEMLLRLDEFDPAVYSKEFDGTVSFGFYEGDVEELRQLVARVESGWVRYYDGAEKVFCGFIDGKVASFCLAEDMGTHPVDGRKQRFAGPGCVGTLPEYRNRGIGLTMVKLVTAFLKDEGYDYSYIHYTGVAPWYAKLGYRTFLCWTRDGVADL